MQRGSPFYQKLVCAMIAMALTVGSGTQQARAQDAPALGPPGPPAPQPSPQPGTNTIPSSSQAHAPLRESMPLIGAAGQTATSPASFRSNMTRERNTPVVPEGMEPSRLQPGPGWWKTAGALAMVIGLMLGLWAIFKRWALNQGGLGLMAGGRGRAPAGLLEILGRYPVSRGQTLMLLKLDRRVLLVSQSSNARSTRMTTLCEMTDPEEVASILLRAADADGRSMTSRFSHLISGFEAAHDEAASVLAPVQIQPTPSAGQVRVGQAEAQMLNETNLHRAHTATPGHTPPHDSLGQLRTRLRTLRHYDQQVQNADGVHG